MRRLFEDPEQPSELREDLMRSRAAGQDYSTADKLAQLRAALNDPARQPLADAGKSLSWRAIHPGWKLAAVLALGGGAALVLRPAAREPAVVVVEQPAAAEPEQRHVLPAAAEVEQPAQPAAAAAEPVPDVRPTSQPEPAPEKEPASSSRREIAQLVRIRALLEQDPQAAYRLAQRSEREFPSGLLSEERQALSLIALSKTGKRDAAAAKARAFFARFPDSPMRAIIETELAREPR